MSTALTPDRSALGGAAVLMACACGAAANTAKMIALVGIGGSTKIMHPVFIGLGAGLILYGLWRTATPSAWLALVAFAALAVGAVLAPPSVMTSTMMPWSATQTLGGGMYLVAAAILGYAFWRAFPSPKPAASATAIGGVALATGCSCCMVTGAVAGMAVTAGASAAHVQASPLLFWGGLAAVAAGLFRLGGIRPVAWVAAGGIIVKFMPEVLRLTGDWMVADVNLRALPSYLLMLAGTAVILGGFVVAYQVACAKCAEPAQAPLGLQPAFGRPVGG